MASEKDRFVGPPSSEGEWLRGLLAQSHDEAARIQRKNADLEQQLAQARADVERLRTINDGLGKENDEIGQENDQARALLEKIAPIRGRIALEAFLVVQEEIRAFLAQQPKEASE